MKIAPSILSVPKCDYPLVISHLEELGVYMLHLDVMDGIFVPNISIGIPVVDSIRKATKTILDVHLMIDRPHRYIKEFAKYADILGFHYEAGSDVAETLKEIRKSDAGLQGTIDYVMAQIKTLWEMGH
jgi:ribulose-phosphate 3-epimerase